MTQTKTFDDVITETQDLDPEDLRSWFHVIVGTYLTPAEKISLEAQKAQVASQVKQRELSVLYCVAQPHLSVNIRKLKTKIVTIHRYLKEGKLTKEYLAAKHLFTPHQYKILSYALAGYTPKAIAAIHRTTHVNACIGVSVIKSRLAAANPGYPTLYRFIKQYKCNFV